MYITFKRFLAWGLFACLPLVVAGCSGDGDDGGTVPTTTISGTAVVSKPITGAMVQIYQLNTNGSAGALLGSGTSGADGSYAIQIPTSSATPPLLIRVTGQTGATYTSASSGSAVNFTAAESFNAAIDSLTVNRLLTVSPLSEAGYQKLQQVLTDNPTLTADTKTVGATNAYVADIFNVGDLLANPADSGNIANQAALLVIDRMVVDSGTGTTLATMNIIRQAVADVTTPEYQIFLTALNNAGNTVRATVPPSNTALVTALLNLLASAATPPPEPDWNDTTPPTAPVNLSATPSTQDATHGAASLTWTAATDNTAVTGYDIFRDGSKVATVKTIGFTDFSLIPGSTYTYFVLAFDGAGNRSVASNSVSVTPNPVNLGVTVNGQLSSSILNQPELFDLIAPSAPTGLAASTAAVTSTTSSVTLTWSPATDNKGVTGYEVFRDGSKTATVATTGYVDAAVTSGVAHTYFVLALDAAGNKSPASSTISVTPPAANLSVTVNGQISTSITGF